MVQRGGSATNERPNVVASVTLDATGGSLVHGPVTLVVPEGALSAPVTITLAEVRDAPRGAVGPAYEFGPDGLVFGVPATLLVSYESLRLPAGVDPTGLRLSVLDDGRWMGLDDHVNRRVEMRVVGSVRHFSTYGIVADPREVSGRGVRWEANGITVVSSEEMFGRLYVSPTAVSLFVGGEAAGPVAISFGGLPTDGEHQMYVDGYSVHRVVRPADGGTVSLTVDGTVPHYLWLQPRPGTTVIGGPRDQCPTVGVRVGDACTLTSDIVGAVTIEAPDQVLDCAGRRIRQTHADRGTGIGIFAGAFARPLDGIRIRNCVVGGAGAYFFQGVNVAGTADTEVADSVFEHNDLGIYVQASTGTRILRNRFEGRGGYTIQLYEGAARGEVSGNRVDLSGGIRQVAVLLDGMIAQTGLRPTTGFVVSGNRVRGGDIGIGFLGAQGNDVHGNDVDGSTWGVWIGPDGWPNRFWWNNVTAAAWGVYAEMGPAEVSDGVSRGNYWGHDCPAPGFTASVDGNRSDVRDSYAYGARGAWDTGGVPGCGTVTDGSPISPEDASVGVEGVVWDDYVPRSPTVRAAWERLRGRILELEAEAARVVREEWSARGLQLKTKPPLPPIVSWNRDTDTPTTIAGRMTAPARRDAHAVVQEFLRDYVDLFGVTSPAAQPPDLRLEETRSDSHGTMFRFKQHYRGLAIEDGTVLLWVDREGALRSYSGQYFPRVDVNLRGTCTRHEALAAARQRFLEMWPDVRRFEEDAEMVLSKRADGTLAPDWIGAVVDRDDPWHTRHAGFVVDARDCTVTAMDSGDDEREYGGAGEADAPVEGRFYAFGGPEWDRTDTTVGARRTFTYTHGGGLARTGEARLRSDRMGILGTFNHLGRSADASVYDTGFCAFTGSDGLSYVGRCWNYASQRPLADIHAAGCWPNREPRRCDPFFSHYECVTAFWRVQDRMHHIRRLNIGYDGPGGLGPAFRIWCHAQRRATYGTPWSEDNQIILGDDVFTSGDLWDYWVIDHEMGHHVVHSLIGSRPRRGRGCCYRQDYGQSHTISEVLADFLADRWSGQFPGTYHWAFSWWMDDGRGTPMTYGFYPAYDLERADCRPVGLQLFRQCNGVPPFRVDCPAGNYCWEGVCRSRCLYIAPGLSPTDSYNFHGETGTKDPHGNENGRVLAQALADYSERFGSVPFVHVWPFWYGGPDASNRTMFTARELGGTLVTPRVEDLPRVTRDWGVSHDLDPSAGVLRCIDEGWVSV